MLLQAERLTKTFGSYRAVNALDLSMKPGEIVGILGPNGSGKSTAIRMMLGFLRPTSGHAYIAGHECWKDSVAARRHVAYLPGELRLYENMTGRELVDFLGHLRGQELSQGIARLSQTFDIDVNRPLAQLSSGMKRKIALMAVLLPETPLVILDEPTNTLDPSMRDELLSQLLAAKDRGQAVLFSSHVLSEVEHVCDRVAILKKGRLVHWQDMRNIPEVHRVRVHATSPPDLSSLPREVRTVENRGKDIVFECAGDLADLLQWLARQPIAELQVEPRGLAEIYSRFHQLTE